VTPEETREESRQLRRAFGRFATRHDLLQHPDAPTLQQRLDRLLGIVHNYGPDGADASGPSSVGQRGEAAGPTVHAVHWNILHGCHHQRVLDALQNDPALRDADLISLNEVDIGMQRSGNIDVGRFLARNLGLHGAWCALFLELQGGDPQLRRHAAGESPGSADQEALFGLGLLSRHPLTRPRRLVLETPADLLFDREGKVGDFVALLVTVQHPVRPFDVVVTHLDVHGTPLRRLRQMQQILQQIPPGPMLLSGDLNTTTFPRGSLWRSLRAFSILAMSPATALQRRLWRPDQPERAPREPLFDALRGAGFEWEHSNDGRESLDLHLADVQEVQRLPGVLRRIAAPVLHHVEARTTHRLDWIASRGMQALGEPPPVTRVPWMRGERAASDHAPLACTFSVEEPARM
jgi:endonuclease/exonuclease/phosphatase family metal-dependent hydrolase